MAERAARDVLMNLSAQTQQHGAGPLLASGRSRVVIENVQPQVDGGRFAVKRSVGETVRVEADAFADGHDKISLVVRHRIVGAERWNEVEMSPLVNDRWFAEFAVHAVGLHECQIVGWVDRFATWRYDFVKRVNAGQQVGVDLKVGAQLVADAAAETGGEIERSLSEFARFLRSESTGEATEVAVSASLQSLMKQHSPRQFTTEWPSVSVKIWVDRWKARFSSWYEIFPRSASPDPARRGTFKDVEARLPSIAAMGFDVLYLPPIHPIGRSFRKGKNNAPVAEPGDVGSPWAIGAAEGGHDVIHP